MDEIFDVEAWRQILVSSLSELGAGVAGFLPSVLGALLILGVGWLISKLVEVVGRRLLRQLGFDRAADRIRATATLQRAGLAETPSGIVARLLFWVLMLTFLLSAVETLGLDAVTATIDRLIAFLPNVIAAVVLLTLGLLFGRFAQNVVGSGAAAANLAQAQRLGAAANSAVVAIVAVLALEQLGFHTQLLVTILATVLASVGITMGLAFALGARSLITHILAGHFLRQSLPAEGFVEIGGRRGRLERVGPVDTLLRDEERSWSIPNGRLLEEIVIR